VVQKARVNTLTGCVEFLVNKLANIFLSNRRLPQVSLENARVGTLQVGNSQRSSAYRHADSTAQMACSSAQRAPACGGRCSGGEGGGGAWRQEAAGGAQRRRGGQVGEQKRQRPSHFSDDLSAPDPCGPITSYDSQKMITSQKQSVPPATITVGEEKNDQRTLGTKTQQGPLRGVLNRIPLSFPPHLSFRHTHTHTTHTRTFLHPVDNPASTITCARNPSILRRWRHPHPPTVLAAATDPLNAARCSLAV